MVLQSAEKPDNCHAVMYRNVPCPERYPGDGLFSAQFVLWGGAECPCEMWHSTEILGTFTEPMSGIQLPPLQTPPFADNLL